MSIPFEFLSFNIISHQGSTSITSLMKCIVIFGSHVDFSIMISCIGFAVYSVMPIITTRITITKEGVLILGNKLSSWLFNLLFWELGIFSFNFLIDAKTNTRLVKWRSLVAHDLIQNFGSLS